MWLSSIFERFVEKSPVTVILRAMMEVVLADDQLNNLFDATAQRGYTRELLFSTLVKMMTKVVCSISESIGSVYKEMADEIGVSKTAVYDKLNRLEPSVSQALVRETALKMKAIINTVGISSPSLLPNYRVKILDGNCLGGTEHRLAVLRRTASCEIKTLGYPRAALFSFCMALVAYNLFSCLKTILSSVHGTEQIEGKLSYYYLAAELEGTYKGMMIALPTEEWQDFGKIDLTQLSALLQDWARLVNISAFTSAPRKPKQKKPKPPYDPRHPHVSTARLLDKKKKSRASPPSK